MVKEGPDAEVQEFRLADLELRLRTMQAGAESDYLSGVLANGTAMSHSRFIGYPAFQALRTVSFLRHGECEAGDATRWRGAGARM